MGDAALADPAVVPNLQWLEHPDWATARGYLHFEADYRLITDNLLDLSHETYIHHTSIGNSEADSIAHFPPKVTIEAATTVRARRDMHDIEPPPAWTAAHRFLGRIDLRPGIDQTARRATIIFLLDSCIC